MQLVLKTVYSESVQYYSHTVNGHHVWLQQKPSVTWVDQVCWALDCSTTLLMFKEQLQQWLPVNKYTLIFSDQNFNQQTTLAHWRQHIAYVTHLRCISVIHTRKGNVLRIANCTWHVLCYILRIDYCVWWSTDYYLRCSFSCQCLHAAHDVLQVILRKHIKSDNRWCACQAKRSRQVAVVGCAIVTEVVWPMLKTRCSHHMPCIH